MVRIQENIPLASHTTFGIGGPARYFAEPKSAEEIIECCKEAKENLACLSAGGQIFVLGGGSNVLISDKGFDGLVIKIENCKLKIENFQIIADAGILLAILAGEAAKAGLSGLEWAVGIPGTVGGAVCVNTGAYGHSISESVEKVKTISMEDFSLKEYAGKCCGFVYRGSRFKKRNEIILEVILKLRLGNKEDIFKTMKETLEQRKNKLPVLPSAGSFFKNYKLRKNFKDDPLIKKFPELLGKERGGKIAAGYLMEQCGLKGTRIGGAMVANEHSNFLVNTDRSSAEDVVALMKLCREKVHEKYGFNLEEEVCMVGF